MVSPTIFNEQKKLNPDHIEEHLHGISQERRPLSSSDFFYSCMGNIFLLIIYALFSVAAFLCFQKLMALTQDNKYEEMFLESITKFNKTYSTIEEYEYRYRIFVMNVHQFEAEEMRHPGLDLDVNEFTDRTDDELMKMIVEKKNVHQDPNAVRFEGSYIESGIKRPASIDWKAQGKLTPIKNQGQCGSCWAFATVAAVEAQYAIKKGSLVSLSEQEMVDCDSRNNGCSGGYRPYAMKFVKENGLESEKSYPYSALKHDQCLIGHNDTKVYIDDYRMLSTNEEDVANWVGTKGPVTFGMNVVKAMYSYRSGIFNPSAEDCAEKSMGAHALTIVGYGGEGESAYWIVKNSWGTSWGSDGYFRLARGVNSCGMANTVVAPIIN